MAASIRAFFALTLDERARGRAMELARGLEAHHGKPKKARMMPAASLHLTLKYLGPTEDARVPALAEIARRAAEKAPVPAVQEARFAAFPDAWRARVVVLDVRDDGGIARLAAEVEAAAALLGFAPEARPFRPHVTLARLEVPCSVGAWIDEAAVLPFDARFDEVTLMKSESAADGPRYVPIARARVGQRSGLA